MNKTATEVQTPEVTRDYAVLNVSDIKIDETYQRPLRDTHKKIAANFDPNRLGTIIVSNRGTKEKPDYYVIDGQHRLEAFKILEHDKIPALVITGLTFEEEAKIFVKQGENQARITGSDIYNAGKHFKGTYENRLFKICEKTGMHCVDSAIKAQKAGPRAYSAYKIAIKLHGDEVVEKVFTMFKKSKHTGDNSFYVRYMFDALVSLVADKNLTYNQIFEAIESYETVGEIYNAANQSNMYAYANNVSLSNVIRARIKQLNKKK